MSTEILKDIDIDNLSTLVKYIFNDSIALYCWEIFKILLPVRGRFECK